MNLYVYIKYVPVIKMIYKKIRQTIDVYALLDSFDPKFFLIKLLLKPFPLIYFCDIFVALLDQIKYFNLQDDETCFSLVKQNKNSIQLLGLD